MIAESLSLGDEEAAETIGTPLASSVTELLSKSFPADDEVSNALATSFMNLLISIADLFFGGSIDEDVMTSLMLLVESEEMSDSEEDSPSCDDIEGRKEDDWKEIGIRV